MIAAIRSLPKSTLATVGIAILITLAVADKKPALLLALPVVIMMLTATVRWPLIAVSLLIIMITSNASSNLQVHMGLPSLAKLFAPGMLALLILRYFLFKDSPHVARVSIICMGALFSMKLIGATYAADWNVSLEAAFDFFKNALVAILAVGFLSYAGAFRTIVLTAVYTLAALCMLGAVHIAMGLESVQFFGFSYVTEGGKRYAGPIDDPNFFGAIVVFAIPIAIHKMLAAPNLRWTLHWGAVSLALVFGLVVTESRGAIVAVGLGMLVLMTTMSVRQISSTLVLGVLAVFIIGATATDKMLDRLNSIAQVASEGEAVDKSTEGRLASWRVAYELTKQNPLLGVGPGNFNTHYQDTALEEGLIFRGSARSAHSLYLEFLSEQGMVGLFLFLLVLGIGARNVIAGALEARRGGDPALSGLLLAFGAGCVSYFAAMAFLHDSYPRFLWLLVALSLEAHRVYGLERAAVARKGLA